MGQDYVLRKAAKKQRKRTSRDAETGRKTKRKRKDDGFEVAGDDDGLGLTAEQVKRRRKKGNNVSLRISRALCYKPPELTADDLHWDGTAEGTGEDGAAGGMSFKGFAEAACDSDVEEAMQKHQPQQAAKAKPQKKQKQPAAVKLSTAVNLLNPAAAARAAASGQQQQQRLPLVELNSSKQGLQQQLDEAVAAAPALQALREAGLDPIIPRCMAKLGFVEPTPIQSACWGPAAAGQDVLGHAEPGSGKTLAYLLPAFAHVIASSSSKVANQQQQQQQAAAVAAAVQPRVLVLLPARELAQQVHGQCPALFSVTGVSTAVLVGGAPKEQQVAILQRRQPQLLVATPGRLLDLYDCGAVSFDGVSLVVLDEADKMLSVGFEPQLQRLKALLLRGQEQLAKPTANSTELPEQQTGEQQTGQQAAGKKKKSKKQKQQQQQQQEAQQVKLGPKASAQGPASAAAAGRQRCQVLMFSATLPKAVRQTAAAWLQQGYAAVSCSAGADSISKCITQVVQVCAEHKKPAKLLKHLAAIQAQSQGARNPPRVLVFANRIKTVAFVHRTVTEAGYRAVLLHGSRSQPEREAAVADFKAGKAQVLVASDVASRGLDIRGLPYVVNYDFPTNLEVYIHRVGRTGRLAAAGHAFSFFTRPLAKLAAPLISLLQAHEQAIDPNLLQLSEAWAQAEAAIRAKGGSLASLEAAAGGGGGAAGEEEEEEQEEAVGQHTGSVLVPEDLQEGLSAAQLAATAAGAGSSGKQQQQQPLSQQRSSKKHLGDAVLVPQGPTAAAGVAPGGSSDAAAAAAAAAAAVPPFIPAPKFAGAKPGYAFKKGSRGVGYYVDPVQQRQQQAQQARQQRKQEQQQVLQLALKQYKQQQQGGQHGSSNTHKAKAAAGDNSSNKPSKHSAQAAAPASGSKGSKGAGATVLPPLPGLKKRKLPAFAAGDLSDNDGGGSSGGGGGGDTSSSGSDSDGGGRPLQRRLQRQQQQQQQGGGKRRKALPGRLRKKLAKAAAGVKGGTGAGGAGPPQHKSRR